MRISMLTRFERKNGKVIVSSLESEEYDKVNLSRYYPFPERIASGKVGASILPLFNVKERPSTIVELRNPLVNGGRTLVFPGGHVDYCSNPVETAIKEFVEEIHLLHDDELLVPYPANLSDLITVDTMRIAKNVSEMLEKIYGIEINSFNILPVEFLSKGLENIEKVMYIFGCEGIRSTMEFCSYVDYLPHDGVVFLIPALLRFDDAGVKPEDIEVINFEFGGEVAFIQSLRALLLASPEYFHPTQRRIKDIAIRDAMKLLSRL